MAQVHIGLRVGFSLFWRAARREPAAGDAGGGRRRAARLDVPSSDKAPGDAALPNQQGRDPDRPAVSQAGVAAGLLEEGAVRPGYWSVVAPDEGDGTLRGDALQ